MNMSDIKIVLVGIGNVASVLLQGLYYYKDGKNDGLWHPSVGNYKVSDIKIVGAIDIDAKKIGKDLAESIPNSIRYVEIPSTSIKIEKGILRDEFPIHLRDIIDVKSTSYEDILDTLENMKPDIVVNLISSGLDNTSRAYAEASLEVGSDFINATPTDLQDLASRFDREGLMLIGDDLISQFGGTALHKGIVDFMVERGIKIEKSYQLDVGGSMETLNTMDERIKYMKRRIKTDNIDIEAPYEFESIAGTTEYTQFLNDARVSYYWIKGKGFINIPVTLDIALRTHDGANAANVLLDVIRAIKYCKDNDKLELKDVIAAYGFKRVSKIRRIREAYKEFVESFVV